jgi:hypothetical protein
MMEIKKMYSNRYFFPHPNPSPEIGGGEKFRNLV